jgi:hypothetical protein
LPDAGRLLFDMFVDFGAAFGAAPSEDVSESRETAFAGDALLALVFLALEVLPLGEQLFEFEGEPFLLSLHERFSMILSVSVLAIISPHH